tara:strand:+ start:3164 stop:5167 length:2004 start_codon:yes stop_codon:yes gene_type:complete
MRAARICSRIPESDPQYPQALALLGTIRAETGRAGEAIALLNKAARLIPDNARIWGDLGDVSGKSGRFQDAAGCFRRATLLEPGVASIARRLVDWVPAPGKNRVLRRCSILSPLDSGIYLQLGLDRKQSGHFEAASHYMRRLLLLEPAHLDGTFQFANVLLDLNNTDGAKAFFLRTLRIAPRSGTARNNLGLIAFGNDDFEHAEEWFRAATAAAPGLAEAWRNHARALAKLDREADALEPCKRSLMMEPANQPACMDMAGILRTRDWVKRVISLDPLAHDFYNHMAVAGTRDPDRKGVDPWLRRSAVAKPEHPEVWFRLSSDAGHRSDPQAVVKHGHRAFFISDSYAHARNNTAFALLGQERFEEGWRVHTRRLETPEGREILRRFAIPEWQDEAIEGKHLLLWGEQGIGDEVQFLTLLKHVRRMGARATVLAEPRLRPLIRRSFPDVMVPDVDGPSGAVESHHGADFHLAIGDLPHRLRLFCGGQAAPDPWVVVAPVRAKALRAALQARHPGKHLVGITWRSSAPTGARRSIPPALWAGIAEVPGSALVSLQYSVLDEDMAAFEAAGIQLDNSHGVDPMQDLDGLAALTSVMDLVISPPNNTVHFAGALAVPCWVMVPTRPDWRWGLNRSDSLWYPKTRVYRQETDGDWEPVLSQVVRDLRLWSSP